jgi:hypothetical protein
VLLCFLKNPKNIQPSPSSRPFADGFKEITIWALSNSGMAIAGSVEADV